MFLCEVDVSVPAEGLSMQSRALDKFLLGVSSSPKSAIAVGLWNTRVKWCQRDGSVSGTADWTSSFGENCNFAGAVRQATVSGGKNMRSCIDVSYATFLYLQLIRGEPCSGDNSSIS